MAIEIFKLVGSIMVDNDKAKKSIADTGKSAEDTGGKFDKLGELAKKAAGVIGTVFTAKAIIDFGKTCINAAEALDQTMKKTNVIFGESADIVEEWALANERTFGLGSGTIQGFMNDIADITQGMGMAKESSIDLAKGATELGVQLANWNGIDAATAINDIQSAMTGSTKSLEKYGIKINEAAKEQAMLSLGLSGTYDKLDNATKAQVIYQAALEASGNAVDYWNEGNRSMGFYINEAKEQFGNITETIGNFFLPMAKKGAKKVADMTSELNLFVSDVSKGISAAKEEFEASGEYVNAFAAFWETAFGVEMPQSFYNMVGGVITFFHTLWTTFTDIVSTIATPVIDIIKGLFDGLKSHSDEIFNTIADIFYWMAEALQVTWDSIGKPLMDIIVQAIGWVKDIFAQYWPQISQIFGEACTAIKGLWERGLKPVFDVIKQIIENVLAPAFKFVFDNVIKPVVEGSFKHIIDMWNKSLKPVLEGITDFLSGVFSGNFTQAFEGIVKMVSGIWEGIIAVVKNPINTVIGIINNFIDGLNTLKIPDWVPIIGGNGINISHIPMLAKGTDYFKGGMAIVGEQGPELVEMPRGAKVYTASETKEKLSGGNTYNFYSNEKLSEREIMRQQRNLERRLSLGLA